MSWANVALIAGGYLALAFCLACWAGWAIRESDRDDGGEP